MSDTSVALSGLVSNFDWDALVEATMAVAEVPALRLEEKVSIENAKKSVYAELGYLLDNVGSASDSLRYLGSNALSASSGTSSSGTVATVTAGSQAPSAYAEIEVFSLATVARTLGDAALYTAADSQAQAASTQSSSDARAAGLYDSSQSLNAQNTNLSTPVAASGTFTINGIDFSFTDSQTLDDILGDINRSDAGVTASFNNSTGIFSLSSKDTGGGAEVVLSQSAGNFLEAFNLTAGTSTGSDAVSFDQALALTDPSNNMDTAVTAGTFSINGILFNVDPATDTLNGILNDINNSSAGVTAYYSTTTGRVSMQNNDTGASNTLTLGGGSDTSNFLSALKLTTVTAGTDASISVNGGAAQNYSENEIDSVLPGGVVTVTGPGTTTVSVGPDSEASLTAVKSLVTAFNDAVGYIQAKLNEQPVEGAQYASEKVKGSFIGDSIFMDALTSMTSMINETRLAFGGITELSEIGLTLETKGVGLGQTLTLDENTFRSAFVTNRDEVMELISASGSGLADKLYARMKSFTAYDTGSISLAKDETDKVADDMTAQAEAIRNRMEIQEESMRRQYIAMETLLNGIKAQGTQLASVMSSINASQSA